MSFKKWLRKPIVSRRELENDMNIAVEFLVMKGDLEKLPDGQYRFVREPDFSGFEIWHAARCRKAGQ